MSGSQAMNTSEKQRRVQATVRSTMVVYGVAGFLSTLFLPLGMQPLLVLWLVAGNLVMARHGIAPPDHGTHTLRFWFEHFKMALAWPVLLYWVRARRARVTRRDPWRMAR